VESDVPWYGVVIHDLPATSFIEAHTGAAPKGNIWDLLEKETGIPNTEIWDLRDLCSGKEAERSTLSLRVMLKDPDLCGWLCQDGAFLLGSHSRVSRYCARRRVLSSSRSGSTMPN